MGSYEKSDPKVAAAGGKSKPFPVRLRPHHGLCLQFFKGKGYSSGFTAHMEQVKRKLEDGGRVKIVKTADEICSHCPNLQEGCCVTDVKVREYDRRVAECCGLKAGMELNWEELSALVGFRILEAEGRERICPDCQWSDICR